MVGKNAVTRVHPGSRLLPVRRTTPIVLVKRWKVGYWNAKKLLQNCQKTKKLLRKFLDMLNLNTNQKLYVPFCTMMVYIGKEECLENYL